VPELAVLVTPLRFKVADSERVFTPHVIVVCRLMARAVFSR